MYICIHVTGEAGRPTCRASHLVLGQLVAGAGELLLDLAEAVLEDGDDADAAVDGIAEAHVGLVGERVDGVLALVGVELVEDLGDVAGAEDAVHVHKLLRIVRREIGREHAVRLALAPEELAGGARRARAGARAAGDRAARGRRGHGDHGARGGRRHRRRRRGGHRSPSARREEKI
jgi:hypothetical protein